MDGPEWTPHHHYPVRQGGGVEMASVGGGGDYVEHDEGFTGLRMTPELGNVIQVTGADDDGIG